MPSTDTLKGRVAEEALSGGKAPSLSKIDTLISEPTASGKRIRLEYQEHNGTRYLDRACLLAEKSLTCG